MILLIQPRGFFNSVWLTNQIANLVPLDTYLASSLQSAYTLRLESISPGHFHTEETNDKASDTVSRSSEAVTNSTDSRRILVVEDEGIIAMDIISNLHQLSYIVTVHAISGLEAIKYAEETRPDPILMDIRLRVGMDGIEAVQRIRSQDISGPIIVLTAFADENMLQRTQSIKCAEYMLKPFSTHLLAEAIAIALQESDDKL